MSNVERDQNHINDATRMTQYIPDEQSRFNEFKKVLKNYVDIDNLKDVDDDLMDYLFKEYKKSITKYEDR